MRDCRNVRGAATGTQTPDLFSSSDVRHPSLVHGSSPPGLTLFAVTTCSSALGAGAPEESVVQLASGYLEMAHLRWLPRPSA